MPGCDRKTFHLFLFYLANKRLPQNPKYEVTWRDDEYTGEYDGGESLGRLWIFGDFLMLPELQNLAMKSIVLFLNHPISVELISVAYKHSAEGSPLRKLVLAESVDNHVFRHGYGKDREGMDRLGALPGFFCDFMVRLEENSERLLSWKYSDFMVPEQSKK